MEKSMDDVEKFFELGREVAREAGKFLLEHFRTALNISYKGTVNLVTEVDIAAEELMVARIRKAFPTHSIQAEENYKDGRGGAFKWVIDPLDGTTNYAHGYPIFAVSIGLEISGNMEWGAVFDPIRDELFTARRGWGARCNDLPLHVSKTESLLASLLATGFPYDVQTSERNNLANFCAFARCSQGIRRGGSAALDLSYVAAGRFDGFWELKLNPWDCAAGYLLVIEAGGTITNFSGQSTSIYDGEIVASNGRIHQEMLTTLQAAAMHDT